VDLALELDTRRPQLLQGGLGRRVGDAGTVLLIGHNPTMAYLVHLLDDGSADADLFARVSAGFPTSALAVLDVPCSWSDLDVGGARITGFHVGRG